MAVATVMPTACEALVTVLLPAAAMAAEQKPTWPGQAEDVLALAEAL
jgi:hypothetical protein